MNVDVSGVGGGQGVVRLSAHVCMYEQIFEMKLLWLYGVF